MSRPTSGAESTNNQRSTTNTNQPTNNVAASSSSREVPTLHDFTGTTIELQVNATIFRIHESRISRFASLNQLIENSRRTTPRGGTLNISVRGNSELVSDFLNTFNLLNVPLVEPIDLSSDILVSAARISATYDYPVLRAFSIQKLEALPLGSIERLRIGRALNLESWEERACQELSERDEMITEEEMLALGTGAYFRVASMRERRQRNQASNPRPVQGVSAWAPRTGNLYGVPDFDEPFYEEPDFEEPDFEEPYFEEPDYDEPDYDEPDYDEPDYDRDYDYY